MRYGVLVCCLVGALSLGCSKAAPQPVGGAPAEPDSSEAQEAFAEYLDTTTAKQRTAKDSASLEGELGPHHGLGKRGDFGTGPEVRLGGITLTAPAAWKRTKPSSSYYAAEFALPHVDKDTADGRLLISTGSGSMESNIDVFKGQFDTASEHAKQEQKEVAGFQVTFVDVSGAYTGPSQSAAATAQPGYRMILAVIPIGTQLNFIKAVGPEHTIAAHAGAINTFVCSVQRRNLAAELSDAADSGSPDVRLEPLTFTASTTWKRTKPRSSLVHAEFALPHAEKDSADGRLTVSVVTGTVKDNIDRWKGQFAGAIDSPKHEEHEIRGLKVTLVDFAGTFGDQAGMMGPVVNRPDYRMIAAIIPISDQLYVVKAVGPRQTIAANEDAIHCFVGSVRRDD